MRIIKFTYKDNIVRNTPHSFFVFNTDEEMEKEIEFQKVSKFWDLVDVTEISESILELMSVEEFKNTRIVEFVKIMNIINKNNSNFIT